MNNIKDFVKIDNRFEKAVNLSLDLQNSKKISNYIPTASSVRILNTFFENILMMSDKRANILIGPYGRGKSHLLLVLLSMLSDNKAEEIVELNKKIVSVYPDAETNLKRIDRIDPFLPVIINPSEESLKKSFYRSLMKSLEAHNLSDVSPDSFYSEAIRTIYAWKQEFPNTYKMFESIIDMDVEEYINRLNNYDEEALSQFKMIYPRLTSGSNFNPLIDDDVVSIYRTVNRRLKENKSYAGIYIVFDEFSKFIEGHDKESFVSDMKTLQDICELSLASKEEQLHITCVAHKSISSYSRQISDELINSFEGVSGRLTEIPFIFSSKNNYELIADAISKKPGFEEYFDDNEIINQISVKSYKVKPFYSLFTREDYQRIVAKGCYPLTPVSAMILLELCEKIAQNERTIFTYLTGTDRSSLSRVIEASPNSTYVGVDSIYDYFTPLFKKDSSLVHHEWLKAEFAISLCEDEEERRLIKALALVKMIGKEELVSNELFLRMMIGEEKESIECTIKRLIDKGLILYRARTNSYEFKNNIGVDVEAAIKDTIHKSFNKTDVSEILNSVNKSKYILPKKHNQQFCITRYFGVQFISAEAFLSLKDLKYIKCDYYPDGLVLFVLQPCALEDAKNQVLFLNKKNLIVVLPSNDEDIVEKARSVLAIRKLKTTKAFTEDNPALLKELSDIEDELIDEINEWIHLSYYNSKKLIWCGAAENNNSEGLNRIVSKMCDETYNKTPVINHELINRHIVSAQIAKARGNIIRSILTDGNLLQYETGSSAESTIYRAVFKSNEAKDSSREIEKLFDEFFANCVGRKVSFSNIIEQLLHAPYGIRRGVLPLLLAHELSKRNGTPVIYLNEKEIPLNEESLTNVVRKPEDYYFFIEEESAAKEKYIEEIGNLFEEYSVYCKDVDTKNKLGKTVCLMQTWYRSLPQSSISFTNADCDEQDMNKLIRFRSIFKDYYLNPRDVLFDSIPAAFETDNFEETYLAIKKAKADINNHIVFLKLSVLSVMREAFGFDSDEDIPNALRTWFDNIPETSKKFVYGGTTGAFLGLFKKGITADTDLIASSFAKAITGIYIEDWTETTMPQFKDYLIEVIEEIQNKKTSIEGSRRLSIITENGEAKDCLIDYNPEEVSVSGTFLKNALVDVLDEYGDVIDNNEKLGILMEIASKLIK